MTEGSTTDRASMTERVNRADRLFIRRAEHIMEEGRPTDKNTTCAAVLKKNPTLLGKTFNSITLRITLAPNAKLAYGS